MCIAIMQPYLFPYIGYFQLINAVDKFVILDDVNYINRGWINRNRILVNNGDYTFTVPLKDASQNRKICDTYISDDTKWQGKLLKTIELAYKKAQYFDRAFPIITEIIQNEEKNISKFIGQSLLLLNQYLVINTTIAASSSIYKNSHLKAQDKIIDICLQEKTDHYINPAGGTEIYSSAAFNKFNIKLNFIKSGSIEYKQFGQTFIPWLSIIDVLMFNSQEEISGLLEKYTLIENE
jgi:hypothetical protein